MANYSIPEWVNEFGVECIGSEYRKEITDRTGPVDISVFVGRKHYPNGKDIVWHEIFRLREDGLLGANQAQTAYFTFEKAGKVLEAFADSEAKDKSIWQLCTDEVGKCRFYAVEEMVAGTMRRFAEVEE